MGAPRCRPHRLWAAADVFRGKRIACATERSDRRCNTSRTRSAVFSLHFSGTHMDASGPGRTSPEADRDAIRFKATPGLMAAIAREHPSRPEGSLAVPRSVGRWPALAADGRRVGSHRRTFGVGRTRRALFPPYQQLLGV